MVCSSGQFECLDCGCTFKTAIGPNGERRLRCEPCRLARESRMSAERARLWRTRNRQHVKETAAAIHARKQEEDPEYRRRRNEISRQWNIENPEKVRENSKRWNAANADRRRANNKRWAIENKDLRLERARRWKAENPDKCRANNHRRYAKLKTAPGSWTAEEFAELCETFGQRCAYCGKETRLTVDHVVPLSRGGSNYIDNIVPACKPCNSSKGARTAEEFAAA